MSVSVTNAGILAYATTLALVVPLFIIAILVDSSRDASRIGPNKPEVQHDRASIKQSRRTLLAITVGLLIEFYSLSAILTVPNDDGGLVAPINYVFVAITALGMLTLLYILFIPHVELHISTIRRDPSTARWTIVVGWLADAFILGSALVARYVGESSLNHTLGNVYLVISLLFTGSMITLTISLMRRNRLKEPAPRKTMTGELAERASLSDTNG